MIKLLLAVFLTITTIFAGRVSKGLVHSQTYTPKNCQNNDCSLKEFKVQHYNYKVHFSKNNDSYGTAMYAQFKTQTNSDLFDYVVVQYIKGCKFITEFKNGKITKRINESRELFGEIIPFQHKEWVIDSFDLDPVYSSYKNQRHMMYRWNEQSNPLLKNSYRVYQKAPTARSLFIRDYPGTAELNSNTDKVDNLSMKFKTCLYREKDVPLTPYDSTFGPNKAIKCFSWQSSFIYDYAKKVYTNPKKIDPFCFK